MGADPRTKKHPFLKARFQIGSCKGPINYAASEPTFHPDDILLRDSNRTLSATTTRAVHH